MKNKVKISLLKIRAQSYYKLKFFKGNFFLFYFVSFSYSSAEAVDDIDTLINMGFTFNQNDALFYMY